MQELTLSYLIREFEICLALKKRGFGEGNWNGYGGKLDDTESVLQGAVREIREESEVEVHPDSLEQVALVDFYFTDGKHLHVHTFFTRAWQGEPQETEEMKPQWFRFEDIPYEQMWSDDIYWLPRALDGEKLRGEVWFKDDDSSIERMNWKKVDAF